MQTDIIEKDRSCLTNEEQRDVLAAFLKISPAAFANFEKSYRQMALDDKIPENGFEVNSRQASKMNQENNRMDIEPVDTVLLNKVIDRAVNELIGKTDGFKCLDGHVEVSHLSRFLIGEASDTPALTNADLNQLPKSIRPQCSGSLMCVDLGEPMSCAAVLATYKRMLDESDLEKKRQLYFVFRQGLDILDLDPIMYLMLGMNKNSMSYWLPAISAAVKKHGFLRIPETKIAKVPLTLLQLSRLDYQSLNPTTIKIVDDWAMKVFDLDVNKSYFIKTGTYSSKFDFRNCKVTTEKEVRELGEYLLFIQYQASMMAGPLSRPSTIGVSTTNEWVVREFIEDVEDNPTIYKGLPLHTEYRVFVDFDTDEILGVNPYWDPDVMLKRFSEDFAHSPHSRHDAVVYKAHEETLMRRYNENVNTVIRAVAEMLPNVNLEGQWSIDIMQNGHDFWLIDMALAEQSAFYEKVVPIEKRKPLLEQWLPDRLEAWAKT